MSSLRVMVVVAGLLLAPAPAAASPANSDGDLLLSADGVHFGSSYRGELFHELGAMVPGDSQSGRFWVQNATAEIAYLRIGIGSVGSSTTKFLESLVMTAGAGGEDSGTLDVTRSLVCTSLLTPIPLASGESVRVDLTVGLDEGAASATQSASTQITMVASLSNADPLEFGDNVCRGDFAPVPAVDPGPTSSPTATSPTSSPVAVPAVDGNTARWYQGYAILVPILAFAGGAVAHYLVGRRRARRTSHPRGTTGS